MKITTADMEIALMRELGIRRNLIVPRVSWGMGLRHECDLLILSNSNYATEIEIKVSRQDLKKDAEKPHGHASDKIARLFFAVPESLLDFARENIPENAGLYIVKKYPLTDRFDEAFVKKFARGVRFGYKVTLVRNAKRNKYAKIWTDGERGDLARLGALRILGLMEKLHKQKGLL